LPFCYLAFKLNHKISWFKRKKASNFRMGFLNVNEFISEEKEEKEEKEELEEELRNKRRGTERADQYEGLYQISDQSVYKRLRNMHSK
jgi:hypothetical protein